MLTPEHQLQLQNFATRLALLKTQNKLERLNESEEWVFVDKRDTLSAKVFIPSGWKKFTDAIKKVFSCSSEK